MPPPTPTPQRKGMKSTIHDIGSIEGITFNVVLNLLFSVPFNVGLELGQVHRKIITKQHWKGERQVPEQCNPS